MQAVVGPPNLQYNGGCRFKERNAMLWIVALPLIAMLAYQLGYRDGWNAGIKIARAWESSTRDYRMMYDMAQAESEEEVNAAYEIRQLERMYDEV